MEQSRKQDAGRARGSRVAQASWDDNRGAPSQLDGIIWALPSPAHLPHLLLPTLKHVCPCFGVVQPGGTASRAADGDKPPNPHRRGKSSTIPQHHSAAPCFWGVSTPAKVALHGLDQIKMGKTASLQSGHALGRRMLPAASPEGW